MLVMMVNEEGRQDETYPTSGESTTGEPGTLAPPEERREEKVLGVEKKIDIPAEGWSVR